VPDIAPWEHTHRPRVAPAVPTVGVAQLGPMPMTFFFFEKQEISKYDAKVLCVLIELLHRLKI
jgi:hypothetical protein